MFRRASELANPLTGEVHDRDRFRTPGGGQLMTKQSHKAECDIHNILRQYQRTGIINHLSARQGQFMDLPDALDFQEAQNTLITAERAFAALPAKIRDEFNNDPRALLEAISDPAKAERLRALGLFKPKEATQVASTTTEAQAAS